MRNKRSMPKFWIIDYAIKKCLEIAMESFMLGGARRLKLYLLANVDF